jgi:hypothetical protein
MPRPNAVVESATIRVGGVSYPVATRLSTEVETNLRTSWRADSLIRVAGGAALTTAHGYYGARETHDFEGAALMNAMILRGRALAAQLGSCV